jgi:hypothetical protein
MENRETASILDTPVVPDHVMFYGEAGMDDVRWRYSLCKGVAAICGWRERESVFFFTLAPIVWREDNQQERERDRCLVSNLSPSFKMGGWENRHQHHRWSTEETLLDEWWMTDVSIPACWQFWGVPTCSVESDHVWKLWCYWSMHVCVGM